MRFTPAICALLLAGCFPSRTADLACVVDQECEEGSSCTQGYCLPDQDDPGPDATPQPDAPPATPDCEDDWPDAPSIFSGCAFGKAPAISVGATSTFDTTNGTWTGTTGDAGRIETIGGQQVRVLIVEGFTFPSGTLRVTGQYPLLVVSWSDVVINGTIDASSNVADVADPTKRGAGANSSLCTALTPGITNSNGGSGGGGGGFGGAGGRGGDGGSQNIAIGQAGGSVIAAPMLAGGCPGAPGGKRAPDRAEVPGGAGGGAVYFASRTSITGAGTIDVGGAGGVGARDNANQDRGGGGGGGSGGFIGLEAPTISFSGTLAANGGGGGAGCDEGNGNNGADGGVTGAAAIGGNNGNDSGGSNGGNGGFGTSAATPAENFDGTAGGGGGGGGGYGHIVRKPG